jgi:hypothetical protein
MVNLPDGQIVIVGGHEDTLIMSRTLFYDPITSIFSEGPPFPEDLDLPLDFPKCAFFYSKKHGNRPVIFVAHGAKPGNNSAWILDYTNSTTWEKGITKPFSYIIASQFVNFIVIALFRCFNKLIMY